MSRMPNTERSARAVDRELSLLIPAFFLSGAAALTYQVAWERVLYSIFGVNVESVTIVVVAFLVGLGFGSLVGGWLSERPGTRHLRWFAIAEACIALFGAVSVPFYHAVGTASLHLGTLATAAVMFGVVLVPTMLMGATLPILVAHVVRSSGSVGWSVGTLYYVNTAGSALAAFLTVTIFLPTFGLQGTVWVAASLNAAVALGALALDLRSAGVARRAGEIAIAPEAS